MKKLTSTQKRLLEQEFSEILMLKNPAYLPYALSVNLTKLRTRQRHEEEIEKVADAIYKVLCETLVAKNHYINKPHLMPRMIVVSESFTKNQVATDLHFHAYLTIHKTTEPQLKKFFPDNSFKKSPRLKSVVKMIRTTNLQPVFQKPEEKQFYDCSWTNYIMKNVTSDVDLTRIHFYYPKPSVATLTTKKKRVRKVRLVETETTNKNHRVKNLKNVIQKPSPTLL
jgi:hypothetical protein